MVTELGMPVPSEAVRLADYERTVSTIHQLTEVRFKLAAFLPALTGAAVVLLTSSELGPLTKATLAAGGLMFSLGIVLYDLRNSQHYNNATSRAEQLEQVLGLEKFGSDKNPGLFGSRLDTTKNMKAKGRDHWTHAYSMVFAGAGVRGGQVIGKSDKDGGYVVDAPYTPEDYASTIYEKLGIVPRSDE